MELLQPPAPVGDTAMRQVHAAACCGMGSGVVRVVDFIRPPMISPGWMFRKPTENRLSIQMSEH